MVDVDRKSHWEGVYESKQLTEESWYQARPEVSLEYLHRFKLPKSASIIDVGGGDSLFVDHLIAEGYENITVLDISEKALERARQRLGTAATKVKWVVSDAAAFKPTEKYDCWHDRAAFHFFTTEADIKKYIQTMQESIKPGGYLVLGTFSENGPERCSGLPVKQYSEAAMVEQLHSFFEKVRCLHVKHLTPGGTAQEFLFCGFRKRDLGR